MQLDAFLASLARFVTLYDPIVVLYRATAPPFADAYDVLRVAHANVTWVEERSFRDDLLAILGDEPYLVFHTDDDVFFDVVPSFALREDEATFTLRLGLNTTYCYPLDVEERLTDPHVEPNRISWAWADQGPGAYSYPLALNGHVFRGSEARGWLARVEYKNPNELESALQLLSDEVRPRMASLAHSRVVSIPANIVNEVFPNRHGCGRDVGELNTRYLAGERIAVGEMSFAGVAACHQEVDYVFRSAR